MQHLTAEHGRADQAKKPDQSPSVMMVDASNFSLSYDHCLCDALQRMGCEVTLARSEDIHGSWDVPTCFEVWNKFYPRTHAYARSHARGRFWKVAKLGEHLASMKSLVGQVKRSNPDVVHFQWLPVPAFDSLFLSRLHRVAPLVLTLHNTTVFHGTAGKLHGVGLRSALKQFDAIVVHTEYSRRQAIERGIEPRRLHVIPHGALTHYRELSDIKPKARADRVVLFFGNLKEYKGVDVLVRAFANLPAEVKQTTILQIVGKPSMDVGPLQALSKELGVAHRIKWELRFVEEHEVPGIFREASVVCLPYREIDQSGVLLTAIAFDRAVVASDVGGIAETIQDGVHGWLVAPGDVGSLSIALERALQDPGQLRTMESAVSSLRQELAWEKIAQKTVELYRTLDRRTVQKRAA